MTGQEFFVLMMMLGMVGHRPDEDRIESRNPRFRHLSPKVGMKAKKSTEDFSHVVYVVYL